MRKKRLYWAFQIFGWGVYFLLNIFTLSINPQDLGPEIIRISRIEILLHTPIMLLFSHYVIRKVIIQRNWLQINIIRVIPRILGLITISALSVLVISYMLYWAVGTVALTDLNILLSDILFATLNFLIMFIIWSTIYLLYHFLESNNTSLKYEAAMNEMHLNQLKSQLNPHFIFNALNSMRALVDEEPSKAKTAITQLSNILRNSLITDKKRVISFRNELSTVRDYLALEGIRFEERLNVHYRIDPKSDGFEIPPMMVQTLVENAIKHGVSNLIAGGIIDIESKVEHSILILKIRNSGQLSHSPKKRGSRKGVGLINTKERLKLIYGEAASFRIYNENDKFVVTEVKIPQRM
ncbi:sensor histidine kinase [Roseivirga sp.]|uniref:sensor histidine kinase n=1 Tax=Roseivirga sp. TaxID=1964215 RepID=UPI003B8E83CB